MRQPFNEQTHSCLAEAQGLQGSLYVWQGPQLYRQIAAVFLGLCSWIVQISPFFFFLIFPLLLTSFLLSATPNLVVCHSGFVFAVIYRHSEAHKKIKKGQEELEWNIFPFIVCLPACLIMTRCPTWLPIADIVCLLMDFFLFIKYKFSSSFSLNFFFFARFNSNSGRVWLPP